MTHPAALQLTLDVNLADTPIAAPLLDGRIASPLVTLRRIGPSVVTQGFKPMVRDGAFAAGELAIGTFLQAYDYGKPLLLLPASIASRLQHGQLVYDTRQRACVRPADLAGACIGIRSYTQTTGMWVRGHLQDDYGVDLSRITWICSDEAHLAEYRDPAQVERVPDGRSIDDLLTTGAIDAAIPSPALLKDPAMLPVIADASAGATFRARHPGAMSVNHLLVVRDTVAMERPDVVAELYRLFKQAWRGSGADPADLPFGIAALRPTLDLAIRYAHEQKIIRRRFTVDELFDWLPRALRAEMI
ncbi:MAG: phosphate ABC transporter substrate-binding protein [Pseudomonadota bacterium]